MVPQQRGQCYHGVTGLRLEYVSQAADQKYHLYLLGDEPGEHIVFYLWDPVSLNGIPILEGSLIFNEPMVMTRAADTVFQLQIEND